MDFALTLQFFALMLSLISIALVPFVMGRDPVPVRSIVRIDVLPPPQWPGVLTRVGVACLLASFVVLLTGCYLLLPA
ncbi:hypothetical protein KNO81_39720 [Paraburkholderia sediminicola]|nr:hypothetical protein [Paraburkholderia sediminicola]